MITKFTKFTLSSIFAFLIFFIFAFSLPLPSHASDTIFEAKVLEIINETEITRENGGTSLQQDAKLIGLDGIYKDKEFTVIGIGDIDVVTSARVSRGDKVLIQNNIDLDGNDHFVITDHVRRGYLYLLAIIFAVLIILIGKKQGLKSILSLVFSFLIIMYWIIPQIAHGGNPLLVSVIGAIAILASIIYLTWGFTRKANIASISILISLLLTGLISIIFTNLTKLSGLADDSILYLVGIPGVNINFQGLLLAAIIIGTLGVLDDVVISQISTIEQLKKANPNLSKKELYKKGIKVGVDHISSMTNTLFLAYAGASLPLLLLFAVQTDVGFLSVINNEMIATEIVRTLTGSIGLILAVPIATVLSTHYLITKK
jgi:uncharacterized membrane protein